MCISNHKLEIHINSFSEYVEGELNLLSIISHVGQYKSYN